MVIANRLREMRKKMGKTQAEVADDLGIISQVLSRYERGSRQPDFVTLRRLAEYYGVSIDYLLCHDDATFDVYSVPNIEPLPEWDLTPLLGTIACGEPILAEENIEDYVKADKRLHANFALRCKGDSMIFARIFDGDMVFIRQQSDVENGEIAAVLIDNEATLKRVYKYPNRIELRPENPTCAPLNFEGDAAASVRILGKAVAFISTVR